MDPGKGGSFATYPMQLSTWLWQRRWRQAHLRHIRWQTFRATPLRSRSTLPQVRSCEWLAWAAPTLEDTLVARVRIGPVAAQVLWKVVVMVKLKTPEEL
mmetsp:Transcript_49246/g.105300  ORF Transcript_49246/g.105300 Transcript_49246/m.105300 type:complete len:99 (-) Transcript_49246:466-762(-)|eukprot:CAMPEP_0180672814 /NCGR_PEP_ID=MMETSP1037_2-20121125/65348_1 /TAXON_ID=632150 /ORGANISM="Azadinium spinosum, Strain 3D9" /LENGTH=98 /DNA_ID=CAMNT_0022702013 /DNA_START=1079 /DNA_END=1375 /DNA_ORIENTATION=+